MCVETCGTIPWGESLIFVHRNGGIIHDPLIQPCDLLTITGAILYGVETPVDKHAEPRFPPPLRPCIAGSNSFGVLNNGDWINSKLDC